jgi:hypothetical protein
MKASGLLVTALAVTSCGPSNGSNSPAPPTIAPVQSNVLEFAVGTANIYGDLGTAGGAMTGLNVAATYRQSNGTKPGGSGSAVNSPTLTVAGLLPATAGAPDGNFSTIVTGPGPTEADGSSMTSTPQTGTNPTTFGVSGGVFGLGIEPFNYNQLGTPDSAAPYPVPVYDALAGTSGDPNQLPAAWGGLPAFNATGNGVGQPGLSMGLDVFEGVTPVAGGVYSLAVSLPANTGTTGKTASFTLASAALLPAFTTPTATADGAGGESIPLTLPAGVTEAYVEIVDYGPDPGAATQPAGCNGASATAPVYYTIETSSSGTQTLPDTDGPGGSPSICTAAQNTTANGAPTDGDAFTVQDIGFDYPWYEASYTTNAIPDVPAPVITGGGGQSDITISSSPGFEEIVTDDGAQRRVTIPASVHRVHKAARIRRR